MSDRPQCQACGKPLSSWTERHTQQDCNRYLDLGPELQARYAEWQRRFPDEVVPIGIVYWEADPDAPRTRDEARAFAERHGLQ